MAALNTSLYNAQIGSAGSSAAVGYPLAKNASGKVRFARIETTVGALATGDTLNLTRLRPGAVVLPGASRIICESPGTTFTVSIGDSGSATRYMASNALGGAARDLGFGAFPGAALYTAYEVTAATTDIILTAITVGTPTTTAKVVVLLAFVFE